MIKIKNLITLKQFSLKNVKEDHKKKRMFNFAKGYTIGLKDVRQKMKKRKLFRKTGDEVLRTQAPRKCKSVHRLRTLG